ncbi:ABC transporter ATP-binding protein [Candidatus Clostridium stratigraminis]|uniref:ATP-binding cassette domain-containing protein n=1 Tax=Candidatus Clostridium stratigraminis TaxID=3381661 RepID=A0ABW8T407_9CLOT
MLKVINLTKNYGSLEVLKGISFEIKKGMIYGFLGQNGAGKTTTMNILTGLIGYNSGEIYLNGKLMKENKRELLRAVGYLPQNPVFYGYMTALEYLNFIGTINKMSGKKINERSEEVLNIVKLKDASRRKIGTYSGGMIQRFGIAVAMFNMPEILILDEPTSALDPEGRMEILELIQDLKKNGTTVFLSTHILNDVERVCDEVSILHQGKIIISEGLEELRNKYIQPIYDVEFEQDCLSIKEKLLTFDWIQNAVVHRNELTVYVSDLNMAKKYLLKYLDSFENPIVSFNLRKSNLEDIFLRMVSNNVDL